MNSIGFPDYTTIVVSLLEQIDALLNNFVFNGYAALSDYLRLPLALIATFYLALFGFGMVLGQVKVSTGEFIRAALKIGFIYMAVTQWNFVSEYLVNFVNSAIGELSNALLSACPIQIPGAGGIDGALQVVLIQFTKLGAVLFDTGGIDNLGGFVDGLVVWAMGYAIVGLGVFEIALSKVMLAILCVFAPLMSLSCFFKPFQPIFDRWLGAIVGFALLQWFVVATLTLSMSLAYGWLAAHRNETALQMGNYGTLPVLLVGILCIGFILKAASLAQNVGGMISSASGTAMVGGMVGGFLGRSTSAASATRNALTTSAKAFASTVQGTETLFGAVLPSPTSSDITNSIKQSIRTGGQ